MTQTLSNVRRSFAWVLPLGALFSSACTFNAEIKSNVDVRCATDKDCPTGYECSVTTGTAVCVPLVKAPPLIIRAVPRQPSARVGDTLVVDVTSSLPLKTKLPTLFTSTGGWEKTLTRVAPPEDHDGLTFVFTLAIDADTPEGQHELRANATASAVNSVLNAETGGFFIVDSQSPRVTLGSPIEPGIVGPGGRVRVSVIASEPVTGAAKLVATVKGTNDVKARLSPTEPMALQSVLNYVLDVPSDATSASWALSVEGLTDVAGNVAIPEESKVGELIVLADLPAIAALQVKGKRYSAQPNHRTIKVWVEVTGATGFITVKFLGREHKVPVGTPGFVEFTVLPTDTEGLVPVTVSASNAAGGPTIATEYALIDLKPPGLVTASSAAPVLTPPLDCPLPSVAAATEGTRVKVVFNLDEAIVTQPEVTAGSLVFSNPAPASGGQQRFEFATVATAGLPNGPRTVSAKVKDDVDNEATYVVGTFNVDQVPPATPTVDAVNRMLLSRTPWGSEATAGFPRITLSADAGAFEPLASVFAYESAALATARELGRGKASATGGLEGVQLPANDIVNVYVSQLDSACNRDSTTPTRLTQGEWVATLGKKVVGSVFENPHQFFESVTEEPRAFRASLPVERAPQLSRNDGTRLSSTSEFLVSTYAGYTTDTFAPPPSLTFDDVTQRLLVFPGSYSGTVKTMLWFTGTQFEGRSGPFPGISINGPNTTFFDPTRQRTIVLSNNNSGELETHAWNGVQFEHLRPAVTPPSRDGFAAAYDVSRGHAIMFGGRLPSATDETWRWDGTTWLKLTGLASPPARYGHRMVYVASPTNPRILLFGGIAGNGTLLGDLHEWTGSAWAPVATTGDVPGPRAGVGLAYDTVRDVVVMAAGFSGTSPNFQDTAETYELSASNVWTRAGREAGSPACGYNGSFGSQSAASMAYDKRRQVTVLACERYYWEWRGGRWDMVGHTRDQWDLPTPEGDTGAYDSKRHRTVSFFSNDPGYAGNMWLRDQTITFVRNAGVPSGITCLTYDSARDTMVGLRWSGSQNETVLWNIDAGTWSTQASPVSQNWGCSLAYDPIRQRVVRFEGWSGKTYEWDGSAWNDVTPLTPSPPTRSAEALHYFDTDAGHVMIFGGGNQNEPATLSDSWQWNGTDWTQRITTGAPTEHYWQARGAYDKQRQTFVLVYRVPNTQTESRIWELKGSTWADVTPFNRYFAADGFLVYDEARKGVRSRGCCTGNWPESILWDGKATRLVRYDDRIVKPGYAITYDSARNRAVTFSESETWTWDGGAWENRTDYSQPTPSERIGHAVAYDPNRQKVLLYGGVPMPRYRDRQFDFHFTDTWEWDGTRWDQVIDAGSAPGPRMWPMLTFNPPTGRILMLGGSPNGAQGAYEWTGDAGWVPAGNAPIAIQEGSAYASAYEPHKSRLLMIGGQRFDAGNSEGMLLNSQGEWKSGAYQALSVVDSRFFAGIVGAIGLVFEPQRQVTLLVVPTTEDEFSRPSMPAIDLSTAGAIGTYHPLVGTPRNFIANQFGVGFGIPTFDSTRNIVLSFSFERNGINRFENPPDVVPAHEMVVDTAYAGFPNGTTVSGISVDFVSGASGSGSDGARIERWNGVRWVPLAQNTASFSAPVSVSETITDSAAIATLRAQNKLVFRAVPLTHNDPFNRAKLITDYASVRLRYTLP